MKKLQSITWRGHCKKHLICCALFKNSVRPLLNPYSPLLGKGRLLYPLVFWYLVFLLSFFFFFIHPKVCKQLPPCPRPMAPRNGGLVCVTIDNAQYCKPMCNQVTFLPYCCYIAASSPSFTTACWVKPNFAFLLAIVFFTSLRAGRGCSVCIYLPWLTVSSPCSYHDVP